MHHIAQQNDQDTHALLVARELRVGADVTVADMMAMSSNDCYSS
jgi:hypothetical protein